MNALVFSVLLSSLSVMAQATSPCLYYFTVMTEDPLHNVKQGLLPKDASWVHGKLEKKYPGVCYADPGPKVSAVLYIAITPDTYHGTRTVAHTSTQSGPVNGTVTDQNGNTSQVSATQQTTTTSYDQVPYSLDYGIYTLFVQRRQNDGKFTTAQTFQQRGLYSTLYGIPLGGRGHHPAHAVIEDAVKWISKGGLNDQSQGSAQGQESTKP